MEREIHDNLMHAPCIICGNMYGNSPKSFFYSLFSSTLTSTCSDRCYEEYWNRVSECFDPFPKS